MGTYLGSFGGSSPGPSRQVAPSRRLLDSPAVRIFSGIQPTGSKHLGNFIGAIRGWVEGQERGEAIY